MGGDLAPAAPVAGAVTAARELGVEVVLVGQPERVAPELKARGGGSGVSLHPASEVIHFDESPAQAVRRKKDSSLVVGARLLAEGQVDAFVSAGSTGALVAAGLFVVGRIPGIERPALAAALPGPRGATLLLDVGAVTDCKPEWLVQFAIMGSVYAEVVLGRATPRVGLLNIGAEAEKGNELTKAVYPLLQGSGLHFTGNVEPRDLMTGVADVVVADGFSGNVALKAIEGLGSVLKGVIKGALKSSAVSLLGALLVKGPLERGMKPFDYKETGGAPFLGVRAPLFKCHGSSDARAVRNGIERARDMVRGRAVEQIQARVAARGAQA